MAALQFVHDMEASDYSVLEFKGRYGLIEVSALRMLVERDASNAQRT